MATMRSYPGATFQSTPTNHCADATLNRTRRIDYQSGRALEILGHAIDYLTDEFVEDGGVLSAKDPRVEAIQLLMELNRRIYFDCPVVPTLSERLWAFLRGLSLNH